MNINEIDIKLAGIDENGVEKEYKISEFSGENTIIYFYPKDNTSGCTQEACDFKENKNRWTSKARVVGVSPTA